MPKAENGKRNCSRRAERSPSGGTRAYVGVRWTAAARFFTGVRVDAIAASSLLLGDRVQEIILIPRRLLVAVTVRLGPLALIDRLPEFASRNGVGLDVDAIAVIGAVMARDVQSNVDNSHRLFSGGSAYQRCTPSHEFAPGTRSVYSLSWVCQKSQKNGD